MKRTRYDAEYERVRRAAKLARAKDPEFPENDEPVKIDFARVDAAHDDFKQQMAALDVVETQKRAEAAARADKFTRDTNERLRLAEYDAAGITPPNGTRCSLELMLRLGWRIEDVGGVRELVK